MFEYLQLLFYIQTLISYKTLYSKLLGHFTLHFMSHFHQELFPQITIFLIVCCCCSVAKLCTTLRCQTLVHQAHLSMRFSRQEYWSGLWLFLTFCSLVFSKCSTMNMYYFCNQKKNFYKSLFNCHSAFKFLEV